MRKLLNIFAVVCLLLIELVGILSVGSTKTLASGQTVQLDYMEYSSNSSAQSAYTFSSLGTGGTITTVGTTVYHTFNSSGNFTPDGYTITVSVQAWGGGGNRGGRPYNPPHNGLSFRRGLPVQSPLCQDVQRPDNMGPPQPAGVLGNLADADDIPIASISPRQVRQR